MIEEQKLHKLLLQMREDMHRVKQEDIDDVFGDKLGIEVVTKLEDQGNKQNALSCQKEATTNEQGNQKESE